MLHLDIAASAWAHAYSRRKDRKRRKNTLHHHSNKIRATELPEEKKERLEISKGKHFLITPTHAHKHTGIHQMHFSAPGLLVYLDIINRKKALNGGSQETWDQPINLLCDRKRVSKFLWESFPHLKIKKAMLISIGF